MVFHDLLQANAFDGIKLLDLGWVVNRNSLDGFHSFHYIYIYQNGATANSSTSEGRCDWLLYTFPKSCVNFGSCWFSSWIFQTSGGWCGSQIVGVYALQVHSGLRKIAKGPGRDTWWDSRLQLLGVQSGRIFHGKSGGKASCMSEAYIKKNHRLVSTKVGQCQY